MTKNIDADDRYKRLVGLSDWMKKQLPFIHEKINTDIQHQVIISILERNLNLFDAYTLLILYGYSEPATILIRSMYESYLWLLYSLKDKTHAESYSKRQDDEKLNWAKKLSKRGLIRFKNTETQIYVDSNIINNITLTRPPSWEKMAKLVDVEDLHNLIYPCLSALTHGSMLFDESRTHPGVNTSRSPEDKFLESFVYFAEKIFIESYLTGEEWIKLKKLRSSIDINALISEMYDIEI